MKRVEGTVWSFDVERACFGLLGFGVWIRLGLGLGHGGREPGKRASSCCFSWLGG
jgi:hypothetical protein